MLGLKYPRRGECSLLYVILAIYTLYSATIQGTRPIISLYADAHGFSAVIIGLLVSCYALLPMLLAIRIGKWLDTYGARSMTVVGSSGILLSLLLPMFYPNLFTLICAQLLMGFSQLFVLLSFQKTVGNWSGNRDKLVATFTLTGSLGELTGPLLTGFTYEHWGFQVSLAVSFLMVLLALIAGSVIKSKYWKPGASSLQHKDQPTESPWKMLKEVNLRKALIISGLVLYSKDLYVAFFPVYANSHGLSPGTIGIIISTMGAMSMVVRICQFWLVKTFGRGRVLTTTLIISGICYLAVTGTADIAFLAALTGLLGAGLGLGQPLSLVYAMNLTQPERHGVVLGVRITFNRASQFAAPFLLGGIGGIAGILPVFWVTGGILLLGAYLTRIKSDPGGEVPALNQTAQVRDVAE